MIRNSFGIVTGILVLSLVAGCTNDVDPPSFAGPSTLARSIAITANKDTLFQNGVDFVDITVTSTSPSGQQQTVPLRAEIMVGGIVQDFGTLSTKNPVTPATIRYTAPNASSIGAGQTAQVVTVTVTPTDSGDFRAEIPRQVELRLVPQGVILPNNPDLTARFTVTPAAPQAFSVATFDASTSTNGANACLNLCSYAWNFGDGTTGSGMSTTHEYRTINTFSVTLTVTDARGAQATATNSVAVAPSALPTAVFTFSPQPAYTGQEIFFNAETSRVIPPRTITNYGWNFGDGRTASGVVVARTFANVGTYIVTLRVTDDAGATQTTSQNINVTSPSPVASFTMTPSSPGVGTNVTFNASASSGPSPIVTYAWSFGSNSTPSSGSGQIVTASYSQAGGKAVTLTVTDSMGRTASVTQNLTVQ